MLFNIPEVKSDIIAVSRGINFCQLLCGCEDTLRDYIAQDEVLFYPTEGFWA